MTKDDITNEALKYDEKAKGGYKTTPSVAYAKGFRKALMFVLPYVQDSFRYKIEKLIK